LCASDWIGLSEYDVPAVYEMIATDFTGFKMVPDRCSQGVLRAYTLMRLMLQKDFQTSPQMMFNGRTVIDSTSKPYYFGNSQGGILGDVYMAASTIATRGTLGVPGGPYSLLLPRSVDFAPEWVAISLRYPDTIGRMGTIGAIQLLWDAADPGGYMRHTVDDLLPNTPPHEILIHHALGDAQVSYVGAYVLGRSLGATMWQSNVNEPDEDLFGFSMIPDSQIAKTAHQVTWDFPGVPPAPHTNTPPDDSTDTHEYPRRQTDAQDMMYHFFMTGEIVNTCGGACHGYIPSPAEKATRPQKDSF